MSCQKKKISSEICSFQRKLEGRFESTCLCWYELLKEYYNTNS